LIFIKDICLTTKTTTNTNNPNKTTNKTYKQPSNSNTYKSKTPSAREDSPRHFPNYKPYTKPHNNIISKTTKSRFCCKCCKYKSRKGLRISYSRLWGGLLCSISNNLWLRIQSKQSLVHSGLENTNKLDHLWSDLSRGWVLIWNSKARWAC